MDKETLSNYGWIVIAVLVLVVMIALATPFGSFVSEAVQSTTKGLFDVNKNALDAAGVPGLTVQDQEFDVPDINHGAENGGAGENGGTGQTPLTPKSFDLNAQLAWKASTDIDVAITKTFSKNHVATPEDTKFNMYYELSHNILGSDNITIKVNTNSSYAVINNATIVMPNNDKNRSLSEFYNIASTEYVAETDGTYSYVILLSKKTGVDNLIEEYLTGAESTSEYGMYITLSEFYCEVPDSGTIDAELITTITESNGGTASDTALVRITRSAR